MFSPLIRAAEVDMSSTAAAATPIASGLTSGGSLLYKQFHRAQPRFLHPSTTSAPLHPVPLPLPTTQSLTRSSSQTMTSPRAPLPPIPELQPVSRYTACGRPAHFHSRLRRAWFTEYPTRPNPHPSTSTRPAAARIPLAVRVPTTEPDVTMDEVERILQGGFWRTTSCPTADAAGPTLSMYKRAQLQAAEREAEEALAMLSYEPPQIMTRLDDLARSLQRSISSVSKWGSQSNLLNMSRRGSQASLLNVSTHGAQSGFFNNASTRSCARRREDTSYSGRDPLRRGSFSLPSASGALQQALLSPHLQKEHRSQGQHQWPQPQAHEGPAGPRQHSQPQQLFDIHQNRNPWLLPQQPEEEPQEVEQSGQQQLPSSQQHWPQLHQWSPAHASCPGSGGHTTQQQQQQQLDDRQRPASIAEHSRAEAPLYKSAPIPTANAASRQQHPAAGMFGSLLMSGVCLDVPETARLDPQRYRVSSCKSRSSLGKS
ncbi:MAG: hypothetical protein WDW36_004608 [Sanguina aurantia]